VFDHRGLDISQDEVGLLFEIKTNSVESLFALS